MTTALILIDLQNDFLHCKVQGRLQNIDTILPPRSRGKVAMTQEGPQREQVGRDHWFTVRVRPQCELTGDDQSVTSFHLSDQRLKSFGQRRRRRISAASTRVSAIWVQEIILEINEN